MSRIRVQIIYYNNVCKPKYMTNVVLSQSQQLQNYKYESKLVNLPICINPTNILPFWKSLLHYCWAEKDEMSNDKALKQHQNPPKNMGLIIIYIEPVDFSQKQRSQSSYCNPNHPVISEFIACKCA